MEKERIPSFKTVEINKNFDYSKCRYGSNDCEVNYRNYYWENGKWITCSHLTTDRLYFQWIQNRDNKSVKWLDEDGEIIFGYEK